jgi:hypothetical protein
MFGMTLEIEQRPFAILLYIKGQEGPGNSELR